MGQRDARRELRVGHNEREGWEGPAGVHCKRYDDGEKRKADVGKGPPSLVMGVRRARGKQ